MDCNKQDIDQLINNNGYDNLISNWDIYSKYTRERLVKLATTEETRTIKAIIDKHIQSKGFDKLPPFTAIRILEILSDPKSNGYDIDEKDGAGVVKLLNGIKKLYLVDSNVNEFPQPHKKIESDKYHNDIKMSKIEWLNDAKKR
ncbi:unnamed protein product [Candida verbasci]|uniref:Uncharacterized protein n=1 Tax=Candida verbasci TaxID=1227364 RepID=A0A9W4XBT2_9ASCO|nr:unnamed protein product [Candida verbasci]